MSKEEGQQGSLEKKAIILVHGIGSQKPLEFLREFTNALCMWINWCAGGQGDDQLVARLQTLTEPSAERGGQADIIIGNTTRIRVYEVYWADLGQAPTTGLFKSLRFSGWIIQALFRPVALTLNARPGCDVKISTVFQSISLVILGFIFFILDLLTIAGRFVKRLSGMALAVQRTLLAYAGDIRLYTSEEKQTFGQEVKDQIVDRFRQTLKRAHDPDEGNDTIVIVGHSLGSVVAYDGLTRDDYVNPLDGNSRPAWPPATGYPPVDKVVALFTLGSPLDKFNYFWPDRISMTPVTTASEGKRIWWGNFQDFLDPVGANLNAYYPKDRKNPYPCRGQYSLDKLFDGPHEYRLCIAFSPGRAHLIYWWSREFMGTLIAQLNLVQLLAPSWLQKTLWGSVSLRLQQAIVKASTYLTGIAPVQRPTEPTKGPMVYMTGFWTVVVIGGVFAVRLIWEKWLSALYISKVGPSLSKGVSYVKEAAESLLSWSGVQQYSWLGFIFDASYVLVSLTALIIILLLGLSLYAKLWTVGDIVTGFAGLSLLIVVLLVVWFGISWVFPYLTYSLWWSWIVWALLLSAVSWIAIRFFLNRPFELAETLRIISYASVFSLSFFVAILIASWVWLSVLKLFAISPKGTTIGVLLLAVFLLLIIRMARLRQELGRSSVERMGDAFYG